MRPSTAAFLPPPGRDFPDELSRPGPRPGGFRDHLRHFERLGERIEDGLILAKRLETCDMCKEHVFGFGTMPFGGSGPKPERER